MLRNWVNLEIYFILLSVNTQWLLEVSVMFKSIPSDPVSLVTSY